MDHQHIRAYFLVIVTTLLGILAIYMFRPFLVTIGLAAVFAVIFTPVNRRLERFGLPRTLASFCTLILSVLGLVVLLTFFGVQLFREAHNVYVVLSYPGSIAHAQQALLSFGQKTNSTIPGASAAAASLAARLSEIAHQGASLGLGYAGAVVTWSAGFILQAIIFLMTFFYFLREGDQLKSTVERFSPLTKEETTLLFGRLVRTISSVMRGTILIALLQGVITTIGFSLFGVPNSVLWGTVGVIAALVPPLGVMVVFIPAALYLLFTAHIGSAIGLAIFGVVAICIVDYGLRPRILSSRTSIHPLLVLLSVLGGIAFFGPAGLFLGPLVISLLLGLLSIYAPAGQSEAKTT